MVKKNNSNFILKILNKYKSFSNFDLKVKLPNKKRFIY